MKDNYDSKQEQAIVELADKFSLSPDTIRYYLDTLYNQNFDKDLEFIAEHLMEVSEPDAR